MKIYFDHSGRGVEKFGQYYQQIYQIIEKLGHKNLSPQLSEFDLGNFYRGDHRDRVNRYKSSMNFIKETDIVILEVSLHSISMGYLLEKSLDSSKPVIALYYKGFKPYFVTGINNDKLQVLEYKGDDLEQIIKHAIDYAAEQQDTRFNFFISPKHQNYLDWIAKNNKIPRSVYLRDLIEADMDKSVDFKK